MAMQPPTDITLHQKSRILEVTYEDGANYKLPLEYLRVFSPSAEVSGHGGPMQLVTGRRYVGVKDIEPVGAYAVRLCFDDGHDTGVYTWDLLREMGDEYEEKWQHYLDRLENEGGSRDPL